MNSFKEGLKLAAAKDYEKAIIMFDKAIELDLIKEAYRERAYCLQRLGYHPDAIDDFTQAIKYFPSNANNYYGRALSNGSLGNYDQALSDVNCAISLSRVESDENQALNTIAKKMGYNSATRIYEAYLPELISEMNEPDEDIRNINIIKPVRRTR